MRVGIGFEFLIEFVSVSLLSVLAAEYESNRRGIRITKLDDSYQMSSASEIYPYLIRRHSRLCDLYGKGIRSHGLFSSGNRVRYHRRYFRGAGIRPIDQSFVPCLVPGYCYCRIRQSST